MNNNRPCCPPPPPPTHHHHDHGHDYIPDHYPFECSGHDSYEMGCKKPGPPPPPPFKYPTAGPFVGTGFALIDTNPYLIDTSNTKYGTVISFAESVFTKVTQRKEPSCIDLAATFDMTENNLTNCAKLDMFNKYTAKKYNILNGVLPIIKAPIRFRIHYTVMDSDCGVVHSGTLTTIAQENRFHMTDIRDMYLQSCKSFVVGNIPSMGYGGIYNLVIDKVDALVAVIDTNQHVEEGVNPYYTFTDNNMKIQLMEEPIRLQTPDTEICIASCSVNKAFPFHATMTNRLRINFVAFMSSFIACGDTHKTWEALYSPTEEEVDQMRKDLADLNEKTSMLERVIERQNITMQKMAEQILQHTKDIEKLTATTDGLNGTMLTLNDELDDLEKRVEALEKIPLATLPYRKDIDYIKGQLTWVEYGNIYQVTKNFKACGDINKEITLGNLTQIKDPRVNIIY